MIERTLAAAAAAFGYFSILPAGRAVREPPRGDLLLALPLVGAAVGGIAGYAGMLAAGLGAPPLGAAVVFAVDLLLTGAIHVDGFLDGCDAFFASVTYAKRREILRDPHHGSFAIAGFAAVAAVRLAAIATIPPAAWPGLIAFNAAAARLVTVPNARRLPDVRDGGTTEILTHPPGIVPLVTEAAVLLACGLALEPGTSVTSVALVLEALVAYHAATWIAKQLGGGLVGDAYGFLIVVAETLGLVILAIGHAPV